MLIDDYLQVEIALTVYGVNNDCQQVLQLKRDAANSVTNSDKNYALQMPGYFFEEKVPIFTTDLRQRRAVLIDLASERSFTIFVFAIMAAIVLGLHLYYYKTIRKKLPQIKQLQSYWRESSVVAETDLYVDSISSDSSISGGKYMIDSDSD